MRIDFSGRFDASALHIAHALKQTEIQKSYNKAREKPIDEYLVSLVFVFAIINHSLSWKFLLKFHFFDISRELTSSRHRLRSIYGPLSPTVLLSKYVGSK